MLPALGKSLGRRAGILARYAAAALFLAAPAAPLPVADAPVPPPEPQPSIEARAEAAALARETLRRIGTNTDLAEWTRTVTERALSVAGADAEGAQQALPAERRAGALAKSVADETDTARVLIFMSLAVPAPSWRQWAAEAARAGAPLVLRGPSPAGLQATVAEAGRRLGGFEAGVAVDPRLFRLFDVSRVPAVVVVPGGVPACARSGCADEDPPPHDRVTGNVGLKAALAAVAAEGASGRAVAQKHLERLRGDL